MIQHPDFNTEQAQALSFIMGCSLAQKAFENPPFPNYANILRHLVEEADRLADSCHMPEFTNHALPHICSIVSRASIWGENDSWIKKLSASEAAYLLIALIVHDLGMLSQDAQDLPNSRRISSRKGMSDLSAWVRSTHVIRLPKLIKRLLMDYLQDSPELEPHLDMIIAIASSHSAWPWQVEFEPDVTCLEALGLDSKRVRGLNSVVAVADLLDEDSNRCDTATLIRHRQGNNLNIAHWIRHSLTAQVEDVKNGTVRIVFRKLPQAPDDFDVAYHILKNHYRLVRVYQQDLKHIEAAIMNVDFENELVLDTLSKAMEVWTMRADFRHCLTPRIISTFEKEARTLVYKQKADYPYREGIGITREVLSPYNDFLFPKSPYTDEEKALLYMRKRRRNNASTKKVD